jgi:hypothetical protein
VGTQRPGAGLIGAWCLVGLSAHRSWATARFASMEMATKRADVSTASWALSLKSFRALQRVHLEKLQKLEAFYENELLVDVPIAKMVGAPVLTGNVHELVAFHLRFSRTLRLVQRGELLVEEPIAETLALLADSFPLYDAYAEGWRRSQQTMTQLMEIAALKEAVEGEKSRALRRN